MIDRLCGQLETELQRSTGYTWVEAQYRSTDYFTEEWVEARVANRLNFLKGQEAYFFDCHGLEKEVHLRLEFRLMRVLLEPALVIEEAKKGDAWDKKEALKHYQTFLLDMEYVLKEYTTVMRDNFYFGLPMSVHNFLYYLERFLIDLTDWCHGISFPLEDTRLYQVVKEWLQTQKVEFSEIIIEERKRTLRYGYRPVKPLRDLLLKDLFVSEDAYCFLMKTLVDKQIIDKDTYQLNTAMYDKSYLVQIIKRLERAGYLREELPINNSIRQRVLHNTFHLQVSDRTLDSVSKLPRSLEALIPDYPN